MRSRFSLQTGSAASEFQLPWQNGKFAKDARATSGSKPIVGIFSVGYEAPYRWKDSSQNPNEVRLWAVDGIAQGFRPWVVKFNAKPLDNAGSGRWKTSTSGTGRTRSTCATSGRWRASGWYPRRGPARRTTCPGCTTPWWKRGSLSKWCQEAFDAARLEQFKVLALPNVANLSDGQCAQLKAFVEKGGGLVATHETSLNDERGKRRADFGLAGLFGASFAGNVIERQQNAYLNLEDHSHPLLAGLDFAGRMIHGVKRVEIRTAPGLRAPLMTVPTYPDLPMEEVYVRDMKTDIPGVMAHASGAGRVVYFPVGHRPDVLGDHVPGARDCSGQCRPLGRERGAAVSGRRAGRARCGAVEAAVLRYRSPRQSH